MRRIPRLLVVSLISLSAPRSFGAGWTKTPEGEGAFVDAATNGRKQAVLAGFNDQLCTEYSIGKTWQLGHADSIISVTPKRSLVETIDGKQAIVDEGTFGPTLTLDLIKKIFRKANKFVGATANFSPMVDVAVVHPLKETTSCGSIKNFANFYNLDAVLPTAESLAKMEVGEVRKITVGMNFGATANAHVPLGGRGSVGLFGAGVQQYGTAILGLRREENSISFRIRFSHEVDVPDLWQPSIAVSVLAAPINFATHKWLIDLLLAPLDADSALFNGASYGLASGSQKGQESVFEYSADLRGTNPGAQIEQLAAAYQKTFWDVFDLAEQVARMQAGVKDQVREFDKVQERVADYLGAPTLSARDIWSGRSKSKPGAIPTIPFFQYAWNSVVMTRDNDVVVDGKEMSVLSASEGNSNAHSAALIGQFNKYDRRCDAGFFIPRNQGHPGDSFFGYLCANGYGSRPAGDFNRSVRDANVVLRAAGVQAGARAGDLALPGELLLPEPAENNFGDERRKAPQSEPQFTGVFTMAGILSEQGLKDLDGAEADVVKAYEAGLSHLDRQLADILNARRIAAPGISYDKKIAEQDVSALPYNNIDRGGVDRTGVDNDMRRIAQMSTEMEAIVDAIKVARAAENGLERARVLATLAEKLGLDKTFGVMIQLVPDPQNTMSAGLRHSTTGRPDIKLSAGALPSGEQYGRAAAIYSLFADILGVTDPSNPLSF